MTTVTKFCKTYPHTFPKGVPTEVRNCIQSLPTVQEEFLEHIGTIEEHTPYSGGSHEGCLLCVSLESDDWMAIAKLGGNTIWYLRLPNKDFCLINHHKIKRNVRKEILNFAINEGLAQQATGYRVRQYGEGEYIGYMEFASKDEATQTCYYDGTDEKPRKATIHVATPKLEAYWHSRHKAAGKISTLSTYEAALSYLAEWTGIHHGIWWQDTYDPAGLSCPHGGLFQSILPTVEISDQP